jgi:dTDP-4-amino-4,6-dideoxygalactose transaminase
VTASQYFILGPEVEAFEQEIAEYSQCKFAVGLTSGTDAILVALMALGVREGDEVITSPNTFVATAMCVARLGAKAVFVDIDPRTCNLNAHQIESAITPKTRAIMPVHLFGQMTDMAGILEIATRHQLPIIEDAAQAVGAEWQGRRAGSVGTIGCLSFFPSKNLGAFGDAGAVVTNDAKLAALMKTLRGQGQNPKYFSTIIGGNFRLDALQAAVLRAKLPHLDGWTAARQSNAAQYRQLFGAHGIVSDSPRPTARHPIVLPFEVPGGRHVYNQFSLRSKDRDGLKKFLHEQGIGTEIYYPQPMHLQACFDSWGGQRGDFPEAEAAADESLAIPIYPELPQADLYRVVEAIVEFHRRAS